MSLIKNTVWYNFKYEVFFQVLANDGRIITTKDMRQRNPITNIYDPDDREIKNIRMVKYPKIVELIYL